MTTSAPEPDPDATSVPSPASACEAARQPPELKLSSDSPEHTAELGRRLGELLLAGDVVGLCGTLGAGKTHLVQGMARGLAVADLGRVCSPTYLLIHEYRGRVPIWHLDTYRLRGVGELYELGWDELLDSDGVILVEWADRVRSAMPASASWVELWHTSPAEPECRWLRVTGPLAQRWVQRWAESSPAVPAPRPHPPGQEAPPPPVWETSG